MGGHHHPPFMLPPLLFLFPSRDALRQLLACRKGGHVTTQGCHGTVDEADEAIYSDLLSFCLVFTIRDKIISYLTFIPGELF